MISLATLGTSLGIIDTATRLLSSDAAKAGAKALVLASDAAKVGGALTQFSSQSHIISRVFIDEALTEEIVLPNLMKHFHEWYAAQIVAALHLSKLITDKVNVQTVLSVVQDGRYDRQANMADNLLRKYAGTESFIGNYLGEVGLEALKFDSLNQPIPELPTNNAPYHKAPNHGSAQKFDSLNQPIREDGKKTDYSGITLRSVKASENKIGPMGELFEVTMTHPNDKTVAIKVPIFVQMQPTILPANVAPRFIDMNVLPSVWHQWTQMRAGEMSFWQDFVFKKSHLDKKKAIVKDPHAASAMRDFLSTIAKKDTYALGDVGLNKASTRSANLANSVVVFTEETVAQAKADSFIDLHNEADRKRYFRDTYTMIIGVVDTMHQRVTVYFNGIDGELDCGYNDFKPHNTKADPNDFMAAMAAFTTNSIGRLR